MKFLVHWPLFIFFELHSFSSFLFLCFIASTALGGGLLACSCIFCFLELIMIQIIQWSHSKSSSWTLLINSHHQAEWCHSVTWSPSSDGHSSFPLPWSMCPASKLCMYMTHIFDTYLLYVRCCIKDGILNTNMVPSFLKLILYLNHYTVLADSLIRLTSFYLYFGFTVYEI